jgi:hypothetical protein
MMTRRLPWQALFILFFVAAPPARAILNLVGTATYLISSSQSPANCVSAQSSQWAAAAWWYPRSASSGVTRYIWTESDPDADIATGIAHRDGHVFFVLRGASGLQTYDLGAVANNTWHLVVVERSGILLRTYIDGVAAPAFSHDTAAVLSTSTTAIGALAVNGTIQSGLNAEIGCVVTWRNFATTVLDRAVLWNEGTPDISAMKSVGTPFYFFELLDGRPSSGPMAYLDQVGAPQWKSNHGIGGASLLKHVNVVLDKPNCVAFWPFQDGPGVDPVDIKNGYVLRKTGAALPAAVTGGVFGEQALYFSDGGLYATKAGAPPGIPAIPALDIYGPEAQFSIVVWYRDYAFPYAPLEYAVSKFVAGLWDETEPGHRQYAMFLSVGDDAEDRVISYFCSLSNAGGKSFNDGFPDDIYNHEWAGSGQPPLVNDSVMHFTVATYDGMAARAYLDGELVPFTYGTHGQRNPFTSGDGGGISGGPELIGDFTVGIHKVGGNWDTQFTGVIAGVAVFDRALTEEEIDDMANGVVDLCLPGACNDHNNCTIDSCTNGVDSNGVPAAVCDHEPVECLNGFLCNPADGGCVECILDGDCRDLVFCDGDETCVGGACIAGENPCADRTYCDEIGEQCVDCAAADFDCDGLVWISDYIHMSDCISLASVPVLQFCADADLTGSGYVDLADFAAFARAYGH